jgi:formylglycine-generating enzyme required for sulfatase activity
VLWSCSSGPAQDATAKAHAIFTETIPSGAVSFDLVWIEDGGFWIGRTEVTWDEYLAYCAFDEPKVEGADAVSRPSKPLEVRAFDHGFGTGRRPAIGMSWNGAKQYCAWLSAETGKTYRLPTVAEWALACAGARGSLESEAWIASNSGGRTHEVGLMGANDHELHDMLGNVWEYCAEPYDPSRPDVAVLRGGSWRDEAADCEARLRFNNDWTLDDPTFPPGRWWIPDGDHIGFRVVCEP